MLLNCTTRLSLGFVGVVADCGQSNAEIVKTFKHIEPSICSYEDECRISSAINHGGFTKYKKELCNDVYYIIPANKKIYLYVTIPAIHDDNIFHWTKRVTRTYKRWIATIDKGILRISVCVSDTGRTNIRFYGPLGGNGDIRYVGACDFATNEEILEVIRENVAEIKELFSNITI